MSFYNVDNQTNFVIKKSQKVTTTIQDELLNNKKLTPIIIFASFSYNGLEFKINPINLTNEGQFQVTPSGGPTQSFDFILNPGYSKVIGTISFDGQYSVEQPSPTVFRWNLSGLTGAPFFGTISFAIE